MAADGQDGGLFLEDLQIGRAAETVRRVQVADIEAFAAVSGDDNPVHLDEAFAQGTVMKGRVAHGMLIGGYISALIGGELPGHGAIYLSQTLRFRRPVRIGDEVAVHVEVQAIEGADAILSTVCRVAGKVVIDGEARVRVRRRAPGGAA